MNDKRLQAIKTDVNYMAGRVKALADNLPLQTIADLATYGQELIAEVERLQTAVGIQQGSIRSAALIREFEADRVRMNQAIVAVEKERDELKAALRHIGYQKPVSSVSLNWHTEWMGLREEAREAIERHAT